MSVSVPPTYTVQRIVTTAAGVGVKLQYQADFLRLMRQTDLVAATVRIGAPDAPKITLAEMQTFRACAPWAEIYLDWSAVAGGELVLFLGNGSEAWP